LEGPGAWTRCLVLLVGVCGAPVPVRALAHSIGSLQLRSSVHSHVTFPSWPISKRLRPEMDSNPKCLSEHASKATHSMHGVYVLLCCIRKCLVLRTCIYIYSRLTIRMMYDVYMYVRATRMTASLTSTSSQSPTALPQAEPRAVEGSPSVSCPVRT
jgi:hypothetical protein